MSSTVQSRTLPSRPTDWTDSVVFDPVGPATLTLSATLTTTARVESLEAGPGTFTETASGVATVGGVSALPGATLSTQLAAYDGTADFAGPSGQVLSTTASARSVATVDAGVTTLPLPASGTATIVASGPGNLAAAFTTAIGATATLQGTTSGGSTVGSVSTASFVSEDVLFPAGASRTAPQLVTIAPAVTGWSVPATVTGFDPGLGTLVGVEIAISIAAAGSFSAVNLGTAATSLRVSQVATVRLLAPSGTVLDTATATATARAALPVSGATPAWVSASYVPTPQPNAATLTDASALAGFGHAGPVALTVQGTGETGLGGTGNFGIVAALTAGATITLAYDYLAATAPLVDAAYYLRTNPDVAAAGIDPAQHYARFGWTEGRNPDPLFDTRFYLAQNPDVAAARIDPLQHYLQFGWKEGRDPSLLFSTSKYLAANPDVAAANIDPLLHDLQFGRNEGRMTFLSGGAAPADPLVDAGFYDAQLGATLRPTGIGAAQQAACSYATAGWQKGLNPDPFFDTGYYLSHNPDVAAAHVDPLLHYETYGWKEGRNPSAAFDTDGYLAANPDVKAAAIDPLLHYVRNGQAEGRGIYPA